MVTNSHGIITLEWKFPSTPRKFVIQSHHRVASGHDKQLFFWLFFFACSVHLPPRQHAADKVSTKFSRNILEQKVGHFPQALVESKLSRFVWLPETKFQMNARVALCLLNV